MLTVGIQLGALLGIQFLGGVLVMQPLPILGKGVVRDDVRERFTDNVFAARLKVNVDIAVQPLVD